MTSKYQTSLISAIYQTHFTYIYINRMKYAIETNTTKCTAYDINN